MTGVTFLETLRRSWRGMVIWGVALALTTWMQVIVVPDVDALRAMGDMMASLPPVVLSMLGTNDLQFLATAEGYLASQYFGIMLLIFGIYAVVIGLNVTINDEERGIMDMMLSLPISRAALIVERTLAYAVLLIGVIVISFVGLMIGVYMTPVLAEGISMERMIIGTLNMIPGSLVMLTFTVFVGAALRRRAAAAGLAAAFIVGSYLIDTLGRAATDSPFSALRAMSFYSYYDGTGVIQNGVEAGSVVLLIAAVVALVALSLTFYRRRDIGL
jgi:ABC-2 type transport system permease protein